MTRLSVAITDAPRPLDPALLRLAVAALCERDADLAQVVAAHGPPPLWQRRPGFATLVRIILEQQVSLASARAIYRRLEDGIGAITAARVSALSPARLRRHGVTRQKAGYIHGLARLQQRRELQLLPLHRAGDDEVREILTAVRGIGGWTADIYLLMALRRPDVWPGGDLALRQSARRVKRLAQLPDDRDLARLARQWRPWRSVAARILWHAYLRDGRTRPAGE